MPVHFAGEFLNQQVGGQSRWFGIALSQFVIDSPGGGMVALIVLPIRQADGELDGDVGIGLLVVLVAQEADIEGD